MKDKTIFGIVFFLIQISLAIFYNDTIDLKIVAGLSLLVFLYILYKFITKKYDNCEL
jgi:hypothetical protein